MTDLEKYRDLIRSGIEVPDALIQRITRTKELSARLRPFKPFQLLGWKGSFYRFLTDRGDRNILFQRVSAYLRAKRGGRLRLPLHFPPEVKRLCELSKAQLAQCVYRFNANDTLQHRVKRSVLEHAKRVIPGGIWSRQSGADSHWANVAGSHRLRKTDWPRSTRSLWPSTPSVFELLEMSRKGVLHLGRDDTPRPRVENALSRQLVSDNIRLATDIVAKYIVGIRSSVEIPEKFLRYFRYRDGFLILTVRWSLPPGLVRKLLSQWILAPFNLWLKDNCSFRNFLKSHSVDEFKTRSQRSEADSGTLSYLSSGVSSPFPYTGGGR